MPQCSRGLYKDQAFFLSAVTQIHLPVWGSDATWEYLATFKHLWNDKVCKYQSFGTVYIVSYLNDDEVNSSHLALHAPWAHQIIPAFSQKASWLFTRHSLTCWPTFVSWSFHHFTEYSCSLLNYPFPLDVLVFLFFSPVCWEMLFILFFLYHYLMGT